MIAEELGKRYAFWTKQYFLHLDIFIKERDEAGELLIYNAKDYKDALSKLKILGPTRIFSAADIDELLDYCEGEGFTILLTALSGMFATQEEYAGKFRRVSRYTNLKNVLTALEYLLKDLAEKDGGVTDKPKSLNPAIRKVMRNESWISLFNKKTDMGLTTAKDSPEFYLKLPHILNDADLIQSENAYWARVFLIASLARNLTVHAYPGDDWFYGE